VLIHRLSSYIPFIILSVWQCLCFLDSHSAVVCYSQGNTLLHLLQSSWMEIGIWIFVQNHCSFRLAFLVIYINVRVCSNICHFVASFFFKTDVLYRWIKHSGHVCDSILYTFIKVYLQDEIVLHNPLDIISEQWMMKAVIIISERVCIWTD